MRPAVLGFAMKILIMGRCAATDVDEVMARVAAMEKRVSGRLVPLMIDGFRKNADVRAYPETKKAIAGLRQKIPWSLQTMKFEDYIKTVREKQARIRDEVSRHGLVPDTYFSRDDTLLTPETCSAMLADIGALDRGAQTHAAKRSIAEFTEIIGHFESMKAIQNLTAKIEDMRYNIIALFGPLDREYQEVARERRVIDFTGFAGAIASAVL